VARLLRAEYGRSTRRDVSALLQTLTPFPSSLPLLRRHHRLQPSNLNRFPLRELLCLFLSSLGLRTRRADFPLSQTALILANTLVSSEHVWTRESSQARTGRGPSKKGSRRGRKQSNPLQTDSDSEEEKDMIPLQLQVPTLAFNG